MVNKKFSAITDGATLVAGTDKVLAVRSGTSDVLVSVGTASIQNTGTSGANVPLLNGTNIWGGTSNTFSNDIINTPMIAVAATSQGIVYANTAGKLTVSTNNLVWDDTNKRLGINMQGTAPTAAIEGRSSSTALLRVNYTGTQGASAGAGVIVQSDPSVATLSGSRLGYVSFAGAYDNSNVLTTSALIEVLAAELWSSTASGSKLTFTTTANTTNTKSVVLTLDQDKSATFAGALVLQSQMVKKTTTVTAAGNYTVLATDHIIFIAKSSPAATQIILPDPTTCTGRELVIKDALGNAAAYPITFSRNIDTSAVFTINGNWHSITIISNGTDWFAI